MLIKSFFT